LSSLSTIARMESIGYTNAHKNGSNSNSYDPIGSSKDYNKSFDNGNANGHMNGTNSMPDEPQKAKQVPIAICGMGMRLPGGISNDAAMYDFLINKQDARTPTGNTRYNVDGYYSPRSKPGTIITKHGYFLKDIDFSKFDLSMFNMTPAEVERLDPNQRLLLEVVREAFEGSGETDWRGKNIGSYVGVFTEDWQDLHAKDTNDFAPYQLIGSMDFVLGNRISYEYDLKGPRY
jgi:acyl transferase domain-containing protein